MIKPTVLLIFVLGIAGYLYLDCSHKHHFELRRSSGYHTFFKSTAYGLLFFAIAALIYSAFVFVASYFQITFDLGMFFLNYAFHLECTPYEAALLDIALLTLSIGFVYPRVKYIKRFWRDRKLRGDPEELKASNLPFYRRPFKCFKAFKLGVSEVRKEYLKREFVTDAESPEFSRLVGRSWEYGLPILFTLSDRKVYIGYVYEFAAKRGVSDLMILPIMGGFRTKDDLKFTQMTPYEEVVEELTQLERDMFIKQISEGDNGIDEESAKALLETRADMFDSAEFWLQFVVTLPFREIVHAHIYDIEQQERFAEKEDKISQYEISYNTEQLDAINTLCNVWATSFDQTKPPRQ